MDWNIDIYTAWTIAFWFAIAELIVIGIIYWRAGDYVKAAIVCWLRRTSIGGEWTKNKVLEWYATKIPKEFRQVIEKPYGGIIEIRREASMRDGNGNPLALFSTEHGCTYNLEEITGDRYFSVKDDELMYAAKHESTGQWMPITLEEYKSKTYPTGIVSVCDETCKNVKK